MGKVRARQAGLQLHGTPGKWNAITDVPGVEVGYATLIEGAPGDGGPLMRTGVTAILPRGRRRSALFAGRHNLNGNGELTGCHWLDDSGFLHGPVMITNTNSVGTVRDAVTGWMLENGYFYPLLTEDGREIPGCGYFYPVVGETFDGFMNDINAFHVKPRHALAALNAAQSGPVAEGNVGGGTGMLCHGFKGGTGTSSRRLAPQEGGYTVGALVQANHGTRANFEIQGVPVGQLVQGHEAVNNTLAPKAGTGSIIVILATDAPVAPWQLGKMCKRAPIGIGRLGGGYENGSGDIFLGFSVANPEAFSYTQSQVTLLSDEKMDPLYRAVGDCVEEAILNAMFAAETMTGREGNTYYALPAAEAVALVNAQRP